MIFDGFEARLKEAIGDETAYGLGKRTGISESLIRKYMLGTSIPSIERAWRLARATGVTLDWLADGTGSPTEMNRAAEADGDSYAYIPLYDARLSAGHGSWNENTNIVAKLAFTRQSLRAKGLEPSNLSAVQVVGDSNEPELRDGDTVMVDHSRTRVDLGGFYVILIDNRLYAKRLQRQFDGGMTVISANPDYQDMVIPKGQVSDLVIVGSVVWQGRWLV